MQPGRLKHLVTIQRRAKGSDAAGQPSTHWELVAKVWSDIRTTSGLESIKSGATTSLVQASIRIRWRGDITSAMRVLHGTTVYEIKAVLPGAGRDYIDLVCEATS